MLLQFIKIETSRGNQDITWKPRSAYQNGSKIVYKRLQNGSTIVPYLFETSLKWSQRSSNIVQTISQHCFEMVPTLSQNGPNVIRLFFRFILKWSHLIQKRARNNPEMILKDCKNEPEIKFIIYYPLTIKLLGGSRY